MRYILKYILLLVIGAFALASCKLEKRIYRKGYHIVWNHRKPDAKKSDILKPASLQPVPTEEPEVIVVSSSSSADGITPAKKKFALGKDTCGDLIYLKNGEKINAKVLEVDKGVIKYKRCDNLDGPLFTVRKSSIALLQYHNGIKENLEFEADQPTVITNETTTSQSSSNEHRKQNPLGIAAFVCAISGFLLVIPFILAIPFGIVSLSQFKRFPDRYTDKWMPRAALIMCGTVFLVMALIIGVVAVLGYELDMAIIAFILFALGIASIMPVILDNQK